MRLVKIPDRGLGSSYGAPMENKLGYEGIFRNRQGEKSPHASMIGRKK
jgi:hypothetical protein